METMVLIFLGTLALSFAIAYLSIFSKLKKTQFLLAELYLKNSALEELFLKTKVSDISSGEDIHKENFIKFLSDSRDWAFTYIEDVQKSLEKFISSIETEIIHFDEYSSTYKKTNYDGFMKKISEEYKELKKLMPIESINKDA